MFIPSKLKILGHEYNVSIVDREELSLKEAGQQNIARNTIKIGKDLPDSQKEETLIHEILHAINPSIDDEKEIEFWAQTIYCVFKENKLI